MKLKEAAKKVEDGIEETLTYCDFPSEHWTRIRTNNVIERLNREIRRRTRVVGTFPDGNSKERKKPATAGFFLIWRGREDLNLRGAFYTPYSLSRGAPSATWVLPQMSKFFSRCSIWRREWDSNPRMLSHRRFSRPVLSTAQPSLHACEEPAHSQTQVIS